MKSVRSTRLPGSRKPAPHAPELHAPELHAPELHAPARQPARLTVPRNVAPRPAPTADAPPAPGFASRPADLPPDGPPDAANAHHVSGREMLPAMSPRHRGAHRHPRRHRYQAFLVAVVVLAVIGTGAVLVGHLDIARASSPGADQRVGVIVDPSASVGPSAATIPSTSPSPPPSVATQPVISLDIPFPRSGPQTFHYAN